MKTKLSCLLFVLAFSVGLPPINAQVTNLGISTVRGQYLLYWPANPSNYLLQSTTNPAGQPTTTNPTGPQLKPELGWRVARGGFYGGDAFYARCAYRYPYWPYNPTLVFGLRCVRGL
jgi:hypothetical protein